MKKKELFEKLIDNATYCRICDRMCYRNRVLSEKNGSIESKVLFIAEAPGRLGADKTNIPLYGDVTGKNFDKLLNSIGWHRSQIFITNAVLCNPRKENGNNDTPTEQEIKNCSIYLNILINLLSPKYIVTLGQKALNSLKYIQAHNIVLKESIQKSFKWNKKILFPLYHPGPRALVHRNFFNQLSDFYFLKRSIKKYDLGPKRRRGIQLFLNIQNNLSKTQEVIMYILVKIKIGNKFKLAKLLYLIDYEYLKLNKKLLTNSFYIRQSQGPLPVNITEELEKLSKVFITKFTKYNKIYYSIRKTPEISFTKVEIELIDKILNKFSKLNDFDLKTQVYFTKPMRRILRAEKAGVLKGYNVPVFSEDDFK